MEVEAMGLFKKLKNVFFEDKKLTKQEEKIEEAIKEEAPIPSPLPKDLWVCKACGGTIECGESFSKFNGAWYHKQCFKAMKRGIYNGNM